MITISTTGLRNAQGRYARYSTTLERLQTERLIEAAEQITQALRAAAPRSTPRDGEIEGPHMGDSITFVVRQLGPGQAQAQIIAQGPRAHIIPLVVEGSPPHIIRSRRGSALAFEWPNGPNGSGIYFFQKVNHPGTAPNPFIERTWEAHQQQLLARVRQMSRQVLITTG